MSTFSLQSPTTIARQLGQRVQQLRCREGWSQTELARRSGVALGTLRRFEQAGTISLARLLKVAAVLRHQDDFDRLFEAPPFRSIAEIQQAERLKARAPKRGRTLVVVSSKSNDARNGGSGTPRPTSMPSSRMGRAGRPRPAAT